MKIIFTRENNIKFHQKRRLIRNDFRYYSGMPTAVVFEVEDHNTDFVTLRAPGYGGRPYGNGAIMIGKSEFEKVKDLDKSGAILF